MPKHKFTREQQQQGGRAIAAMSGFTEHCENAYEAVKFKRHDAWRKVYETRIRPYMQEKGKKGGNV